MRVAQALGPKVAPSETQSIVGALLSMRMRGVVNELVLILQDSHRSRNYPSKEPILRGLSWMITEVGREITTVAPQVGSSIIAPTNDSLLVLVQIVACLQSLLSDPSLQPIVLSTLHILIKALPLEDTGPHIGVVTATLAVLWPTFSKTSRAQGRSMLKYLAGTLNHVGDYIKDFASLDGTPALQAIHDVVTKTRPIRTMERIPIIVTRVHSHNHYVVLQALRELKTCIVYKMPQFRALFNEDIFNPMVGDIMSALYTACQREQEEDEPIRLLVYECMGIIGAVDPDRYEMKRDTSRLIPVHSLRTDDEAHMFAIMLISNVLVDLYRSTSDVSYQGHIIVAIEQLAQFCQFDSAVVEGRRAAKRPRARWLALPQHVIEVVSPLVEAGYVAPPFQPDPAPPVPIYPTQPLYRTWLQTWAGHLITRIKSPRARRIFDVFQHLVRQGDAGVAHDLLPNLVLHALLSEGSYNEQDQSNADSIREEIFAVLHDQVHPDTSSSDKRLLSAQVRRSRWFV
jgi:serine/threonine-protein kinase ATR